MTRSSYPHPAGKLLQPKTPPQTKPEHGDAEETPLLRLLLPSSRRRLPSMSPQINLDLTGAVTGLRAWEAPGYIRGLPRTILLLLQLSG